jgi:protein-S-isoprenylcysteine O-methyltransferase Ste14
MSRLAAALRSLVYATGFVLAWGWLALQLEPLTADSPLPPWSRVPGAALMIAGGALVLACVGWFVVAGRGTPAPFDAPRAFVPGGPYRWTRNPMYVGGLTLLAGFGLWNRSLSMTAFALPAFAAFHLFVIAYEEPTLKSRFGAPYVAYLARVNRWIPKPPAREPSGRRAE